MFFCSLSPVLSQLKNDKGETNDLGFFTCRVFEKDAEVDIKHWQTHLDKYLELDSLSLDTIPGGRYSMEALFTIDKEGCITNIKILNDPGYGLGDRVIRVISGYNVSWIPAERNGRRVKAYRKQAVTFIVEKEECEEKQFAEFIL